MTGQGPAFITGGSSGIGLELAKQLAAKGHDIAIFARDANKLEDAVKAISQQSPNVKVQAFALDVANAKACAQAVADAIAVFGAPAWAIANAGIAQPGEFLAQDLTVFEQHMTINYMGALYFAKACVPAMTESGGKLVFVSSGAAFFGIYGYSAYAPPKFAMRALAEVLRVELAPNNISVSLVYPPDTDTPMLEFEERTKPDATKAITAGGGLWKPEDVAALIIRRAGKGKFAIAPGLQMNALLILHSLIGPLLRWWQAGLVKKHTK